MKKVIVLLMMFLSLPLSAFAVNAYDVVIENGKEAMVLEGTCCT